jgi:hypothetical protein
MDSLVIAKNRAVTLTGWALDLDAPAAALSVRIQQDSRVLGSTTAAAPDARATRTDARAATTGGFRFVTAPLSFGSHRLCAYGINAGVDTGKTLLGCKDLVLKDQDIPVGLARFTSNVKRRTVSVNAWAFDPNVPRSSVSLQMRFNNVLREIHPANKVNAGVDKKYSVPGNHGFTRTWNLGYGATKICISARNLGAGSSNPALGCLQVRFAKPVNLNAKLAALAKTFVGKYRYVMGARNPKVGFDCSGLTQYLYSRIGRKIADTADPQRHQFRAITQSQARPGDLIFFHQGRGGYVWHVGVYEGGNSMVAAANEEQGIRSQSWNWWPNVSFGTVLH